MTVDITCAPNMPRSPRRRRLRAPRTPTSSSTASTSSATTTTPTATSRHRHRRGQRRVGGTTALDAGTTTFTPDADLCGDGAGRFDYTVDDGNGGTDTGHVAIDLTCVNDAPVANDDAGGMVAQGSGPADYDVLANDTDVEGDALSTVHPRLGRPGPGHGDVVGRRNGKVQFTPASRFDGPAVITYTVSDGNGGTDQVTLTSPSAPT